jgi:hypothetical protein
LLSSIGVFADKIEISLKKKIDEVILGSSLQDLHFIENAVLLNEQTFLSLKQLIKHLVNELSSGKVNNYIQVALLGAIKLLKINLEALRLAKVPI